MSDDIHLVELISAQLCAWLCHLSLCFCSFWWSGSSPLSSGNLVLLCMFWTDQATRVLNVTLWGERLERGKAMT